MRGCKCCCYITECTSFTSNKTGEKFQVNHQMNCDTEMIIYVYVGKTTQTMRARYRARRKNIIIGTHILTDHFEDSCIDANLFKIMIDKALTIKDLNKKEAMWMQKMRTIQPHGLNSRREIAALKN